MVAVAAAAKSLFLWWIIRPLSVKRCFRVSSFSEQAHIEYFFSFRASFVVLDPLQHKSCGYIKSQILASSSYFLLPESLCAQGPSLFFQLSTFNIFFAKLFPVRFYNIWNQCLYGCLIIWEYSVWFYVSSVQIAWMSAWKNPAYRPIG